MGLERCYCGRPVEPLITSPLYVEGSLGERVDLPTLLVYCRDCDLVIRDLDYAGPEVASHFALAGYTQPETADELRAARERFFSWLHRLTVAHLGSVPDLVIDFGCSYGHLLDLFAARGTRTTNGIEIVPALVESLRREGRHRVHTSLAGSGIEDGSADAVLAIDSLYYPEGDPADTLRDLAAKLRPGGVLVVRATNRNQLFRLWAGGWRAVHRRPRTPAPLGYGVVGDAKFGFSERALTRWITPLLEPPATYRWERRTKRASRQVLYAGTWLLYQLSLHRVDLIPGLVLVARKV